MIIPTTSADVAASTRVHSSPTLSPFRGWAQDGVSSATALIFEDGLPPVVLTLTPIALRRPTHRPAGLCELLPSLAGRFRLKPLFGWHRQRLPQPCPRLRLFTSLHHLPPFEDREASTQLRRHGASTLAVDDNPFGSPQCGYHALAFAPRELLARRVPWSGFP